MTDRSLIVFDFDGVIVDGMAEYWWSACMACRLLDANATQLSPDVVPEGFRRLRPWVHHGWEMVLLAAELPHLQPDAWIADYNGLQQAAMQRRDWRPEHLQSALDRTRREAVEHNRAAWLGLHQPYPGMLNRLQKLDHENADWAVLTTKSKAFTAELLDALGLRPWRLDGRESGAKPDVLLQLQEQRPLRAFVEDRLATLQTVRQTPGLEALSCLLASWGYLKASDHRNLSAGIQLIEPEGLAAPLAQWP